MTPLIAKKAIAKVQVRIPTAVGKSKVVSAGTGFLVAPDLVLTALHVVGWRNHTPPDVYDGELTVAFPSLRAGAGAFETKACVYEKDGVKFWSAVQDWALLRCETPPPDIAPVELGVIDAQTVSGEIAWQAYGFPSGKPDGIATDGTITDLEGNLYGASAIQLSSKQAAGFWVSGWSGSPVLVDRAVVGILRWAAGSDENLNGQTVIVGRGGILYACPISSVWEEVEKLQTGLLPKPSPCAKGEVEAQINLDDLQRFLLRNFDAAGLASLAGALGVQQASTGDAAAEARSLIRRFETERRLDVLLAEAISRAPHDSETLRRVPLSEELRELLSARAAADRQAAQYQEELRRIDRAIADERITATVAGGAVARLQTVLRLIRSKAASLDFSDLPGIAERVGRFLEDSGNTDLYKLSVAVPMIALVIGSKEANNLAAGEVRDLRRCWDALAQPPVWKRPRWIAAAAAGSALIALGVAEAGWRWPIRWPRDLFSVLPGENPSWADTFDNPDLDRWRCGSPPGSCRPYWIEMPNPADGGKPSPRMLLKKGIVAFPTLQGALYDFGARFRFQMQGSTAQVSWYLRASMPAGALRGWMFTLTRQPKAQGRTSTSLTRSWCQDGRCVPVNENSKSTSKDFDCHEPAADFQVTAVFSRDRLTQEIYLASPESCAAAMESTFWEEGLWAPRVLHGGLALGPTDGEVSFSEISLYPKTWQR